jgi:hypothetical protein
MKTQDKNTQISVYCIQHYCPSPLRKIYYIVNLPPWGNVYYIVFIPHSKPSYLLKYCKSFGIIKQLLPALAVNIIIVHPWDVVFPLAKALGENNTPRVNNYA